jgi:hypothetical protein
MQLGHAAAAALMPARDVIKEKATDQREREKPERKKREILEPKLKFKEIP